MIRVRVVPLPHLDGEQAAIQMLGAGQDGPLVVEQDIPIGRDRSRDVVEMRHLVGEHEHPLPNGVSQPRPRDLGRLIDRIPVGHDRRRTDDLDPGENIQRPWIQGGLIRVFQNQLLDR